MSKKVNNSQNTVAILGYGEIGKSIGQICTEAKFQVFIRELNYDQAQGKNIEFLHISIPEKNNDKFINSVVEMINEFQPKLTIIHSTVTTGTTRKIFQITKLPIIHSPVVGVHPQLYQSIKYIFPKIIGPVDKKSLQLGKTHLKSLGLKIKVYDSSEESETAKLLDLTYFAWNIIFCKWVNELCNEVGLNFDQVYTQHNQIYNRGYKKLRPQVVRPVLKPMKGPIGGHCTIPDVELLNNYFKNRFAEFILSENEKFKYEIEKTNGVSKINNLKKSSLNKKFLS